MSAVVEQFSMTEERNSGWCNTANQARQLPPFYFSALSRELAIGQLHKLLLNSPNWNSTLNICADLLHMLSLTHTVNFICAFPDTSDLHAFFKCHKINYKCVTGQILLLPELQNK